MKTLLTGRSGFLGKYIYNHLKSVGLEIISVGRHEDNTFVADLAHGCPSIPDDIDMVVHAAGLAHVTSKDLSAANNFFLVNLEGTKNLLESMEGKNIRHFVFISTVAVYGRDKGELLDENTPLGATDPYGVSKIQAEHIIQEWAVERNIVLTILRLPLVVGTDPKGNLRDMIKAIRHGYYFNISRGGARKSMVLADDVAKFLLRAAKVGGTYNITDGNHPSFYELSQVISKHLGKSFILNIPLSIAKLLAVMGDVSGRKFPFNTSKLNKITSTLTFDDSKARKAFNWNPTPILNSLNFHNL